MPIINPYSVQPSAAQNAFQILTTLGLTTNLQFCLDAGEGSSYTSGQTWLDLTANDQDFFLGADGSATATDPAFNGVADALSSAEFFSFDGGDRFTYDTTIEAWMETLHKDSAAWSCFFWAYPADFTTSNQVIIATTDGSGTGMEMRFLPTTGQVNMRVMNAGAQALSSSATTVANAAAWNFVGMSMNEATPNRDWNVNGGTSVSVTAYSSPSSTGADGVPRLGARTGGTEPLHSGSRMAMGACWSAEIGAAALMNIFAATRGRFGV